VIYLKFACPPSFWRGACSLELVCFLVLGIWDFRHKTLRQSQRPLILPIEDPAMRGKTSFFRTK
jgi:hypothetical protein